MTWLNEPEQHAVADIAGGPELTVITGDGTDFWRETFYGFVRDSGHFGYREVSGDFTAEVTISGEYEQLYDQSGLMVRMDERTWVKTGIEFTDGVAHLSAVVTREFSDWSVLPFPEFSGQLTLRLTRHDNAIRIQFRDTAGAWQLLRLAYLPLPERCQVGVMCCSPQRSGLRARFTCFEIGPPIPKDLHEVDAS